MVTKLEMWVGKNQVETEDWGSKQISDPIQKTYLLYQMQDTLPRIIELEGIHNII